MLSGHGLTLALLVMAMVAAGSGASLAQSTQQPTTAPPPPGDVTGADLMSSMQSEVRIIARENHDIEEYRAGNNVYMVKVKPRNAPPYYLIDQDGSGNLQWRRGQELERTAVPHWAIVRW